jgi:hypothetical protein
MNYDIYHNPVQMNTPTPAIPGVTVAYGPNTTAQMASGSGPAAQFGGSLNEVPYPAMALGNQSGTPTYTPQPSAVSPTALSTQLQASAAQAGAAPINYLFGTGATIVPPTTTATTAKA